MNTVHKSVLLNEIIDSFTSMANEAVESNLVYVDGTLGGAGHALAMCEVAAKLGKKLTVVGLDQDPRAIERAEKLLSGKADKVILENVNFRKMDEVCSKHGISKVDFILMDLGLSSDELDTSGKGFSFMRDEPIYMTFGDPDKHPFTALNILNTWDEEDIANVIYAYGEEKYSRRIARAIVRYREFKKFETTHELAETIKNNVPPPYRRGKIHPATKTFQALRIAVNDELGALKEGIEKSFGLAKEGSRIAIISFHSLEDRIVKNYFRDKVKGEKNEDGEKKGEGEGHWELLTKKPIRPTQEEISNNSRSRSAKLRIIKKA